MNSLSHSISRVALIVLAGCSTAPILQSDAEVNLLHGTIEYPFASPTAPIGHDHASDHFVIRSTVGNTEYTIEIPESAKDYNIEIPLADLQRVGASDRASYGPPDIGLPQATDQELVKSMPRLPEPDDQRLVEGAFGVGQSGGPEQSPSYSLRLAKINKLYLDRQFEYALVEINNLLTYYPSSAKLYKMKGTVLMKLRNYQLAEIAWTRGTELAPGDASLAKALSSLRERIKVRERIQSQRLSAQ